MPRPLPLALAALGIAGYAIAAIGLPIDRFATSFVPIAERVPLVAAMAAGAAVWLVADAWLVRADGAPRLAPPLTKALFVVSLALAIALDLERLFFLIIVVPVVAVVLVLIGLLARWSLLATGHPWPGAVGSALFLGWAIAVTFPLVAL
jgi:hypothetical protein